MYVCASIRMVCLGTPTPQEVQFPGIVVEFPKCYSKKCTSNSRHYYYYTQSPQNSTPT